MRIPSIIVIIIKMLSDSLHHVCLIYRCLIVLYSDVIFQMFGGFVSKRKVSHSLRVSDLCFLHRNLHQSPLKISEPIRSL